MLMDDVKKIFNLLTFFLGFILIGLVLFKLAGVLTPFVLAFFLAYLFNPLVNKLGSIKVKNKHLPRTLGVLIVFLVLFLATSILVLWLIPVLVTQLSLLVSNLAQWFVIFEKEWLPWLGQRFNMNFNLAEFNLQQGKNLLLEHGKQLSSTMGSVSSLLVQSGMGLISGAIHLVITLVTLFYLLRDWPVLISKAQKLLSTSRSGQIINHILVSCDAVLGIFLRGQVSVMLALGCIYALGLSLVGLNYAILLGFIAGLFNIVPLFGGLVGLTLSLIVGHFQFQDWHSLGLIFAVFGVGHLLENMVLTPYLIGNKLGLHPVMVIFAVMAGGELFGFFGVLLALPVAAVMVVLAKDFHQMRGNNDVGPTAF